MKQKTDVLSVYVMSRHIMILPRHVQVNGQLLAMQVTMEPVSKEHLKMERRQIVQKVGLTYLRVVWGT